MTKRYRALSTLALCLAIGVPSAVTFATTSSASDEPAQVVPAGQDQGTQVTPLPGAQVFPEPIAIDQRTGVYYVGSDKDGTIFRGHVGNPAVEVFSPAGADGRTIANGLALRGDTLVVTSRQLGVIRSYDTRTAKLLSTVDNGLGASGTFLNDLTITPDGSAYVTDSVNPWLYRITWQGSQMKLEKFMDFAGTAIQYVTAAGAAGINLNGIVSSPDGRYLVVSKRNDNSLYRITLPDKQVTKITTPAGALNTQDGLFLDDKTFYAAQNDPANVVKLQFNADYSAASLVKKFTNPNYMFTTSVSVYQGRMLVVSSQFDSLGSPAAVVGTEPPKLPFRVTTTSAS
jgi:WD40 repeat protein